MALNLAGGEGDTTPDLASGEGGRAPNMRGGVEVHMTTANWPSANVAPPLPLVPLPQH